MIYILKILNNYAHVLDMKRFFFFKPKILSEPYKYFHLQFKKWVFKKCFYLNWSDFFSSKEKTRAIWRNFLFTSKFQMFVYVSVDLLDLYGLVIISSPCHSRFADSTIYSTNKSFATIEATTIYYWRGGVCSTQWYVSHLGPNHLLHWRQISFKT